MVHATEGLTKLMTGGQTGYDLVSFLAGHENSMQLVVSGKSQRVNDAVTWTPSGVQPDGYVESVATTSGYRNDPVITLGHEMAHIRYLWDGGNDKSWYNQGGERVPISEIYTTHTENKLRAEQGLPLRTHYSSIDIDGQKIPYGGQILNSRAGTSLYYDASGNTNYKRLGKNIQPFKY